jgi:hypothetical protein
MELSAANLGDFIVNKEIRYIVDPLGDATLDECLYSRDGEKHCLGEVLRKHIMLPLEQQRLATYCRGSDKHQRILNCEDLWRLNRLLYPPAVPNNLKMHAQRVADHLNSFNQSEIERRSDLRAWAIIFPQLVTSAGY